MTVSFYAGALVFIYVALTLMIIRKRLSLRVSLGDGENDVLRPYVRAHANFVETVPFALFLLFLAEYQGASLYLIHAAGLLLLIGRVLHPLGLIRHKYSAGRKRTVGMVMTLSAIIICGLQCLFFGVIAVFL